MKTLWKQKHGRAHETSLWYAIKFALGSVWLSLLFEPRDLYVGVYWTRPENVAWCTRIDIYVVLIPMLPLKIAYRRGSSVQVRGNFSRLITAERYKLDCKLYGEDHAARRWYGDFA